MLPDAMLRARYEFVERETRRCISDGYTGLLADWMEMKDGEFGMPEWVVRVERIGDTVPKHAPWSWKASIRSMKVAAEALRTLSLLSVDDDNDAY